MSEVSDVRYDTYESDGLCGCTRVVVKTDPPPIYCDHGSQFRKREDAKSEAATHVKRPSSEDMETAAEWLDINEGELGEMESCRAVASWLRTQAIQQELRATAREHGVPAGALRTKLRWPKGAREDGR